MSNSPQNAASSPLLRLAFYGFAIGMALVHVFITFRGLESAVGMEQAQMAREMARGNFFQTKVIRPYAWALLDAAEKDPSPAAMPDITQPPLQPLLWTPAFMLLKDRMNFDTGKDGSIYLLDRVIACYGVVGMLLMLLWTHGTARRLFDETLAAGVVLALILCEPLWELAVSGSPLGLLLPLMALVFRLLTPAAGGGGDSAWRFLAVGIVAALMVMTHWLAAWLVLGIVIALAVALPVRKSAVIWVVAVPVLVLAGWCWWMLQRCGDPLGGAKTLFQVHLLSLDEAVLQRQFTGGMPPVQVGDLLRKLMLNWQGQLGDILVLLGYSLPALCGALAVIHRFRNRGAAAMSRVVGLVFLGAAIGMGFTGMTDDNRLFILFVPVMTVFGIAMLAVLWARFSPGTQGLWQRWGYAILAVGLAALPLLNTLPSQIKLGLTLRNRIYPHWPPYVPDRVSLVSRLIDSNEVVFSDAPWFVAWYADVPAVWIPMKRDEFPLMKQRIEAHGRQVAGFVITPVSSQATYLHEVFTGPYAEWPDLVFRGPFLALDRDFPARDGFEYRIPLPLLALPVGGKENLSLQMTFYSDRARTLRN